MNNENVKNNIWKAGLVVSVLLAIFLTVISIKEFKSLRYVGKDTPIYNSITVNGKGEAISIPDIATFSFGVIETAKTIDEAQTKATTKTNNAIKALKDAGIADKDIKTLSYNINPHYEYMDMKSTLTGYDISQTIQVKVRDLKKAGALLSAIGSLKVQNVNSLIFSTDDIDGIKAEARELAIENAKEKAKNLSRQLGVKLVRITSFYEQGDDMGSYYREGIGADMQVKSMSAVAPEIPTGEQKVISNVSVTYEIR